MKGLDAFDWTHVETDLDIQGHAILRGLLTESECKALAEGHRDANARADTIAPSASPCARSSPISACRPRRLAARRPGARPDRRFARRPAVGPTRAPARVNDRPSHHHARYGPPWLDELGKSR